jgi:hypothetical protein
LADPTNEGGLSEVTNLRRVVSDLSSRIKTLQGKVSVVNNTVNSPERAASNESSSTFDPITFIDPVVQVDTGTALKAFTTYNAASDVGANAIAVILQVEAELTSGGTSKDINVRKNSSGPTLTATRTTTKDSQQVVCPLDGKSFDYQVETNQTWTIKIIGYYSNA